MVGKAKPDEPKKKRKYKQRAKLPEKALALRGSWLVKSRKKAEQAKQSEPRLPRSPSQAKLPETLAEWADLLRALPGYDPFRDQGKCKFDPDAALDIINFFEKRLRHAKGPKARQLFRLERWQRSLLANLFGWKRPDTRRRYEETLLFIPRKNGKTVLAAGLILYMLTEDGEQGAEIYGAASKYEQAGYVWEHAAAMVLKDAKLTELCKINRGQQKSIHIKPGFWAEHGLSTYRVICSKEEGFSGANTSFGVIDELHRMLDGDLVDEFRTSLGARRQPILFYLTTSDYEREGSVCNAIHDYACKVRDGKIHNPYFLPCIYEAGKDDDWTDELVWERANPNMDVSVDRDKMRKACQLAQESPAFQNKFKRDHLNIRTAQDVRWIDPDKWAGCAGEPATLEDYIGWDCWAGLDLSTTRDMTPLVLAFREEDGISILPIFWMPRGTAEERSRKDRIPYNDWIKQGLIRVTEGDAMDYAFIRRDINALVSDYKLNIQEIAVDRLFQGAQLCMELEQDGFTAFAHGQGFLSMAAPTKAFEDVILDGTLMHGGNPVLDWHASNVSVELDAAGNMKPSRKKSTEKIDGIVAAIMAVGRCLANVGESLGEPMVEAIDF